MLLLNPGKMLKDKQLQYVFGFSTLNQLGPECSEGAWGVYLRASMTPNFWCTFATFQIRQVPHIPSIAVAEVVVFRSKKNENYKIKKLKK
jgi:hypothetical protein